MRAAALSHVFKSERASGDTFTAFRTDGGVYRLVHREGLGRSSFDDPPAWSELPPVPGTPAAEGAPSSPPGKAPAPAEPKEKPSWSRTPRPSPRGRPGPGGAK